MFWSSILNPDEKIALLEKAIKREQKARSEAEFLLEKKTCELIDINQQLSKMHSDLLVHQRQLISTEKLAALGELAAGIMHEVNNPLAFVSSNIGTLKDYCRLFMGLTETVYKLDKENSISTLLETESIKTMRMEDVPYILQDANSIFVEVKDGLERIRDIVSHLKDFARTKPGDRSELDVNEVIDSSLKIAHNKLKYNFDVEVCFGEVPLIHGNKNELSQVLLNLLINASQAVETGRGKIKVTSCSDGSKIYLAVADNGKGISSENLDRIFNPFYTTKPVGEGTGLGLSVSAKIIDSLGGEIRVESEVGKGSCFTVVIPVEQRLDER